MKTKGYDVAYPVIWEKETGEQGIAPGLTKREVFAMHAMSGMIMKFSMGIPMSIDNIDVISANCVKMADALIEKLNGGEEK